jgi:poly-gamma-glutamate capsule biosynthesis protein CapA/YwtB (metallophosphatase superfamily)
MLRWHRVFLCLLLFGCCRALPGEGRTRPEANAPPGDTEPAAEGPFTLILAGDVMLGRGVAQALDGDWEEAFAGVRLWLSEGSDQPGAEQVLVLANLESPLTTLPQIKEGYDLRAPPEAVAALRAAGVDAVSLANNHALDAGEAGLDEMANTLREAGIVPWLEATTASMPQAPSVVGLAFDDSVVPLDIALTAAAVADAAAQAEVVIVSIHWGGEYQAAPSARQQAIAQALAEAGATVIAGHGPHVLQRVEWIGETLAAYSLGNLLFDQPYPLDCRWGALLRVTLQGAQVVAVEAIPTVTEQGRVRRADAETGAAIINRLGLDSASE